MIEFQNVVKSYGSSGTPAVRGLNLRVEPGEIFGFLGPNGAGKTTTIKMLVGILRPDSGRILVGGVDIAVNPLAAKRQIGYVPDGAEPHPRLTGREYIEFIADIYQVPDEERDRRLPELLDAFELTYAFDDRIDSYSRGMRQKIAIVGALIHQPKVWGLDEPMVGLDPRSAHVLKEKMRQYCEAGNTVFLNTMSSMVTGFFAAILPILSGNWDYLSSMDPWLAALATAGFLVFMGTGSMVALTTTTREGKQFYHLKALPISAHTYVRAKWWSANVYCLAIALVASIAEVAVLHMSPSAALMGTVMGLVACAAYNAFAVLLDLSEPNLNWANEQMAFQGRRVFLLLIGELLVGGVVAGVDAVIHFSLHLDWLVVYGINFVLAGAALVIALSSLNENAPGLYVEIE
jgi:ABC-2 type transport system ATP-binding protein